MGERMLTHFDADVPPSHLLRDCRRSAGAKET